MTIDKIIQKIKAETAVNVDNILKNAQKTIKEMKLKAQKEQKEQLEKVRDTGEKQITIMRNIHLSEARRASSRNILNAKEELIETCFAQAREQLRTLTGQEYRNIMTRLIKESLALLGDSGVVTLTREEDKAILSSFPNLTVKPKLAPGLGGLIIESKDGKIVVDNTFEAILNRHREDIRTEVANILYPDET